MKKRIILLSVVIITVLNISLFVWTLNQKQLVVEKLLTKEETIETLKGLLQEYGFANKQKDWKMDIDECCITIEYEQDGRIYRIVYPTNDIDKIELEEGQAIYMIHYCSDIATFTHSPDDNEPQTHIVPFMHVNAPLSEQEIEKMLRSLGDACTEAHTRYYVTRGWWSLQDDKMNNFIGNIIAVDCPTSPEGYEVEDQYESWYKAKYSDRYKKYLISDKFSTYKAKSYNDAIRYRNNYLNTYRKSEFEIEEFDDNDFRYSCNESK